MSAEIVGKRVLLLGYGREGESTHRFLLKRYPQLEIDIADAREVEPIAEALPGTTVHFGPKYLDTIGDYDTVIHTPVIPVLTGPLAKALSSVRQVTSATNLFFEHAKGRIIGITGTKGKSTTSSLIAAILRTELADVRLAGNIGKPMLDDIEGSNAETVFVLELSSFQLEDLRRSPSIAVLLDIVPEHLDHHSTFEAYQEAKARITRLQSVRDFLVFNPEFELPSQIARASKAQKIPFGNELGANNPLCWIGRDSIVGLFDGRTVELIALKDLPLRGPGNVQNVMAAVTVGIVLGVPAEKSRRTVREFKPLEHRLEIFGTFKEITFVNDSLSTIPEALIQGLEAFPGAIDTVIAGGFDRGLDYKAVGPALAVCGARNAILFPSTGEKIWQALLALGAPKIRRFDVSTMEDAVALAFKYTKKGGVCLMSPASSSFNLFRDYRERGERFKNAVKTHQAASR